MRAVAVAFAGLALLACASDPATKKQGTSRAGKRSSSTATNASERGSAWPPSLSIGGQLTGGGASTEGRASYYSRRLIGRKTASGEPYDPERFTAAHRDLPLGTWVRVTRLPDGPAIEVRINDRCGCTHGRIIDLSETAARRLRMLGEGVIPVRLDVLGK